MKFVERYGWFEFYVDADPGSEKFRWCSQTFGKLGDKWDHWGGWYKFRAMKDVTFFLLRWG